MGSRRPILPSVALAALAAGCKGLTLPGFTTATEQASSSAGFKTVTAEALLTGGSSGTLTRNVDTVSTMVTEQILTDPSFTTSKLDNLDPSKLEQLETDLGSAISTDSPVPDLTDPTSVTTTYDEIATDSPLVEMDYTELDP